MLRDPVTGYRDYLINVRVRMNKGGSVVILQRTLHSHGFSFPRIALQIHDRSEGAWHTCELQIQLDPIVEAESGLDSLVAYEYFRDVPRTVLTMLLNCPEDALPDEAALNAPVRPSAVDKRRAQLEVALQNRGIRPSGFLAHDRETLQRCFDEEHEEEYAKWEAAKAKRDAERAERARKRKQEEEEAAAAAAALLAEQQQEEEKEEGKKKKKRGLW